MYHRVGLITDRNPENWAKIKRGLVQDADSYNPEQAFFLFSSFCKTVPNGAARTKALGFIIRNGYFDMVAQRVDHGETHDDSALFIIELGLAETVL